METTKPSSVITLRCTCSHEFKLSEAELHVQVGSDNIEFTLACKCGEKFNLKARLHSLRIQCSTCETWHKEAFTVAINNGNVVSVASKCPKCKRDHLCHVPADVTY